MDEQKIWTVRVPCNRCGTVRVNGTQTVLRVAEHDGSCELRFQCSTCGRLDLRPVDDDQACALIDADVRLEWWARPADLGATYAGPPIDENEIEMFVDLLQDGAALCLAVEALEQASEHPRG